MRILLDNNVPVALASHFPTSHYVEHVRDRGWQPLLNGELIAAAEGEFEVLFTADRNMQFQTNLSGRSLMVLAVRARSNRLADMTPKLERILQLLSEHQPGQYVLVD